MYISYKSIYMTELCIQRLHVLTYSLHWVPCRELFFLPYMSIKRLYTESNGVCHRSHEVGGLLKYSKGLIRPYELTETLKVINI